MENLKELLIKASKAHEAFVSVETWDDNKHWQDKFPECASGQLQRDIVNQLVNLMKLDSTFIDKLSGLI